LEVAKISALDRGENITCMTESNKPKKIVKPTTKTSSEGAADCDSQFDESSNAAPIESIINKGRIQMYVENHDSGVSNQAFTQE